MTCDNDHGLSRGSDCRLDDVAHQRPAVQRGQQLRAGRKPCAPPGSEDDGRDITHVPSLSSDGFAGGVTVMSQPPQLNMRLPVSHQTLLVDGYEDKGGDG